MQVISNPSERKSIAGIPVVEEFSDVFADDFPRLPLVCNVEFTIDLEPRAALVHKAPYRMAPVELKELKAQLQELVDKGCSPVPHLGEHPCCLLRRKMAYLGCAFIIGSLTR